MPMTRQMHAWDQRSLSEEQLLRHYAGKRIEVVWRTKVHGCAAVMRCRGRLEGVGGTDDGTVILFFDDGRPLVLREGAAVLRSAC